MALDDFFAAFEVMSTAVVDPLAHFCLTLLYAATTLVNCFLLSLFTFFNGNNSPHLLQDRFNGCEWLIFCSFHWFDVFFKEQCS